MTSSFAPFSLTGKVALVTGAGRGIGLAVARALAQAGADIGLNALTPRYLSPAAEGLRRDTGRDVLILPGDLSGDAGAGDAVAAVLKRFGRIDILVNGLGGEERKPLVALPDSDEPGMRTEEVERSLRLNLMGAIAATRAAGPHFLRQRSGKVINISSATAAAKGSHMVVYTAAKTALVGFTRAQALEWAPYNVNVNCIAPGIFPDPDTADAASLARSESIVAKTTPLGRAGHLAEVGYLALYLASPASDFMTGQTLFLDGGFSL